MLLLLLNDICNRLYTSVNGFEVRGKKERMEGKGGGGGRRGRIQKSELTERPLPSFIQNVL